MLTPKLVTLWYRAPEILLRCQKYGLPVDIWGLGCILCELLNKGMPILPGRNEVDQFVLICELIGKPCKTSDWPEFFQLQQFDVISKMSNNKSNNLWSRFEEWPNDCTDLIHRMLCWDPD